MSQTVETPPVEEGREVWKGQAAPARRPRSSRATYATCRSRRDGSISSSTSQLLPRQRHDGRAGRSASRGGARSQSRRALRARDTRGAAARPPDSLLRPAPAMGCGAVARARQGRGLVGRAQKSGCVGASFPGRKYALSRSPGDGMLSPYWSQARRTGLVRHVTRSHARALCVARRSTRRPVRSYTPARSWQRRPPIWRV